MLVCTRPKYMKCRQKSPRESKLWTIRRTIIGDSVQPTNYIEDSPAIAESISQPQQDSKSILEEVSNTNVA